MKHSTRHPGHTRREVIDLWDVVSGYYEGLHDPLCAGVSIAFGQTHVHIAEAHQCIGRIHQKMITDFVSTLSAHRTDEANALICIDSARTHQKQPRQRQVSCCNHYEILGSIFGKARLEAENANLNIRIHQNPPVTSFLSIRQLKGLHEPSSILRNAHSASIPHATPYFFSFSLSSKQTQIAAMRTRSTPGAQLT